jgi:VanZ family protein
MLIVKKPMYLIAAIGWSAALVLLAIWSLPAPEVFIFSLVDKVKHGAAYGALGLLWTMAVFTTAWRPRWLLATVAAAYAFGWGALTEAVQLMVPGRQADLADLAADAVGIVICVLAYWWAGPADTEVAR